MLDKDIVVPKMEVGLIVVTPLNKKDLSSDKKYVVEKIEKDTIFIVNDLGELKSYSAYKFMEADLYYTICLFSTMITVYNLGSKSYK